MATRRHRKNKNKKVGKKRIGRTRKHRSSSSRRMRGGIECVAEGWSCIFPFVVNDNYTDPSTGSQYKFKNRLDTKYTFILNNSIDEVIRNSNITTDQNFLKSLIYNFKKDETYINPTDKLKKYIFISVDFPIYKFNINNNDIKEIKEFNAKSDTHLLTSLKPEVL